MNRALLHLLFPAFSISPTLSHAHVCREAGKRQRLAICGLVPVGQGGCLVFSANQQRPQLVYGVETAAEECSDRRAGAKLVDGWSQSTHSGREGLHCGRKSTQPVVSRDRIVVSTLRCGRSNPGSNPGHGSFCTFLDYCPQARENAGVQSWTSPCRLISLLEA